MPRAIPKTGERVPRSAEFIARCSRLLDVGCNAGIIKRFLGNKVIQIYGIDNSLKDLKKARKNGFVTKYVNLDKDKIPFDTNFFDAVACLDVIEHVRDPQQLVKEMSRVLKKNGRLIITTPNIRFSNHLIELIFKGTFPKTSLDSNLYDGGHIHFFTYTDLKKLLISQKFKIDKIEGIINKPKRGWKGQILEIVFGKTLMLEFRAPGILIVAIK